MKYPRFIISALTALLITMFYVMEYKYQLSLKLVGDPEYLEYLNSHWYSFLEYLLYFASEIIAGYAVLFLFAAVSDEIKKSRVEHIADDRALCEKYFLHLYASLLFAGTVAWVTALTMTDAIFVQTLNDFGLVLFSGAVIVVGIVFDFLIKFVSVATVMLCLLVLWIGIVQIIDLITLAQIKMNKYPKGIKRIKCAVCISGIVVLFAVTLYFPLRIIFG